MRREDIIGVCLALSEHKKVMEFSRKWLEEIWLKERNVNLSNAREAQWNYFRNTAVGDEIRKITEDEEISKDISLFISTIVLLRDGMSSSDELGLSPSEAFTAFCVSLKDVIGLSEDTFTMVLEEFAPYIAPQSVFDEIESSQKAYQ